MLEFICDVGSIIGINFDMQEGAENIQYKFILQNVKYFEMIIN